MSSKTPLMTLLPVLTLALLCIFFVHFIYQLSREDIDTNIKRAALAGISDVITSRFNNDLFNDMTTIDVPDTINGSGKLSAHLARQDGRVTAIALLPVTTRGYSGPIRLIVGLDVDGSISGIKVISHNETPGFGGQVHQDKTDWLSHFTGRSLDAGNNKKWATKNDGGQFDQLSGATITSRSVINVVHEVLTYYAEHPEKFQTRQAP